MLQSLLRTFLARQHSSRNLLDMMQYLFLPFHQAARRELDPQRFECSGIEGLFEDEKAISKGKKELELCTLA